MTDTSASLLERLRLQPDAASWERLTQLYTPLLHRWLSRHDVPSEDADDLVQDVMQTLVQELPRFHYDPGRGSFRGWLRSIMTNRLRMFWRARKSRPLATGDSNFLNRLNELEDARSELSRTWDREHDRQIAQRLLELLEPEFEPATWQAFRRQALEGIDAATVAAELGTTVNAAYLAKYRVMRRMRQELQGLTD